MGKGEREKGREQENSVNVIVIFGLTKKGLAETH